MAEVIVEYIGSLKVKTTVVVVETLVAPSAGTVESIIGCACACKRHISKPPKTSRREPLIRDMI